MIDISSPTCVGAITTFQFPEALFHVPKSVGLPVLVVSVDISNHVIVSSSASYVFFGVISTLSPFAIPIFILSGVVEVYVANSLSKEKSFENVYLDVIKQANDMIKTIFTMRDTIAGEDKIVVKVISEVPPPRGQFAPGLYALDVLYISHLYSLKNVESIYRLYPNYLAHVHGKRNYAKSESVTLAKRYYKIITGNECPKINHDEAESFIFLSRLLVREGVAGELTFQYPVMEEEKELEL